MTAIIISLDGLSYKWNCFRVESTRVSDVDVDLSCDILFSFEFFTLLVLLLLLNSNLTVNRNAIIRLSFYSPFILDSFGPKSK